MSKRTALAGLWTLVVLIGCTIPGDAIRAIQIFTPDKLYHIAAFVGYALLWSWAGVRFRAVLWTGLAFAVFIEVWQAVLPIGRYADPYDTLADAVGLGLGLWAWATFLRVRAEQR